MNITLNSEEFLLETKENEEYSQKLKNIRLDINELQEIQHKNNELLHKRKELKAGKVIFLNIYEKPDNYQ